MSKLSNHRGLLSAAAAATAFASTAQAADLGPYGRRQEWRPPGQGYYQPNLLRWTGFYGGIQAGYGWGTTDATTHALNGAGSETFNYGTSGGLFGAHLGYNWQSSNFVLGLESDLEMSSIKGSGIGNWGGGHVTNFDWLGSLRARAGISTGSTLFYVTGGLAYGGVTVERSAGAGFTPFTGTSDWKAGWTLGAGIEHAFTRSISARIEYRYTDLGQITYTNPAANLTDTSDLSHSAIRAGLSFKF